jgi:hypothetical protein
MQKYQVIKAYYEADAWKPHRIEVLAEDSDAIVAWRMMAHLEAQCNDPHVGDLVIFSVRAVRR